MNHTIHAICDSGVLRPLEPVELPEGTQVQVQVQQPVAVPSGEPEEATAMAWADFIERTYGSCAGLGLQR